MVVVACSRPTLMRLLHTTGFDRIVPVVSTVDEAVEVLNGGGVDDEVSDTDPG